MSHRWHLKFNARPVEYTKDFMGMYPLRTFQHQLLIRYEHGNIQIDLQPAMVEARVDDDTILYALLTENTPSSSPRNLNQSAMGDWVSGNYLSHLMPDYSTDTCHIPTSLWSDKFFHYAIISNSYRSLYITPELDRGRSNPVVTKKPNRFAIPHFPFQPLFKNVTSTNNALHA